MTKGVAIQPTISKPRRSGYLPGLDGWRCIAILAVLMDHDAPWSFEKHSNAGFHEYGGWGVYLFFAISGLLVCTRILEDESLLGRFHVRAYYVRRFFRIQPAAIAYVAVIALLTALGIAHQTLSSILGALFLYQNYVINLADVSGGWFLTGHFWTLAIEEHFYLILSLLLLCFKQWRIRVFSLLLLLLYLFQLLAQHAHWYSPLTSTRHTELNIQYLLTPALFALLLRRKAFRDVVLRYLHPWVAFVGFVLAKIVWFSIFPLSSTNPHKLINWVLFPANILFYSFEFWVVATIFHPRSWTTRFLELKPLRYIGRLSYSIYLWHALFFIGRLPQVGLQAHWLLVLTERPWRYIATIVMTLLSYYFIEKPCIRLGHRLAPPATPGHLDLEESPSSTSTEHPSLSPDARAP